MQQRALQLLEPFEAVSIHPARCPSLGPARPSKRPSLVVTWPLCASASGRCHQRLGGTSGNPPATAGTIGAPCIVRAYVGPNLRTGPFCKLRLPVCILVVLNVQFIDSARDLSNLQTGFQFANCVIPVCRLKKKVRFTGVCLQMRNELCGDPDRQHGGERRAQGRIFTETLQKKVGDEDVERSQFLTERKYEEVRKG